MNVDNLRALLAKATPGPLGPSGRAILMPSGDMLAMLNLAMDVDECHANVALIVAAVNALPGLLDELDALRAVVRAADAMRADAYQVDVSHKDEDDFRWEDRPTAIALAYDDARAAVKGE